ncbi:MAG: nitroreductase family protein [Candidatus Saccharibacteria bacterium]
MDFNDVLINRRSVRKYKTDPVPREHLMELVKAGGLAATAGNFQPWEFVVIDDRKQISALKDACMGQEVFDTAPAVICVCADPEKSATYGDRGMNYYCKLDCANATQNILLTAYNMGYGSLWVGGFKEDSIRQVLGIPAKIHVVSLIPIGKPDYEWNPPKREVQDMIHWDKW